GSSATGSVIRLVRRAVRSASSGRGSAPASSPSAPASSPSAPARSASSRRLRSAAGSGRGASIPASTSKGSVIDGTRAFRAGELTTQAVAGALQQRLHLHPAAPDLGGDVLHGQFVEVLQDQDLTVQCRQPAER